MNLQRIQSWQISISLNFSSRRNSERVNFTITNFPDLLGSEPLFLHSGIYFPPIRLLIMSYEHERVNIFQPVNLTIPSIFAWCPQYYPLFLHSGIYFTPYLWHHLITKGLIYFTHAIYYKGNREKKTKKKKKKSAEKRKKMQNWKRVRETEGGGSSPRCSNRLGGANVRERERNGCRWCWMLHNNFSMIALPLERGEGGTPNTGDKRKINLL